MKKLITYMLVGCMIFSAASPVHAGAVSKESVTEAEDATLTAQEQQDAAQLVDVAGGNGAVTILAAVGVVFIVLIVAGALS